MKKTVLNWIAISILFLGSIAVVINRYTQIEETEATTSEGLNIIGLALVWFIAVIAVSFLATNIKGYIQQNSFGKVAITVYSGIFLFLTYSIWLFVGIIKNSAKANIDDFVINMEYHLHTLWLLMIVGLISILVTWIDWVIVFISKLKGD